MLAGEEVGAELARVIARTYGDQSFKKGEKPNLGEEIADVLWVLICLANQTRVIPMTKEVTEMFRAIIQDRPEYKVEKVVGGYTGFLFLDKNGMPLVAMHWEHRFNSMVGRYNEIYKVQMPNITPHV